MALTTAIFDMDGLIIDSEPLWYEAAIEVMNEFNISIDQEAYNTTTGLRTKEFLHHWFSIYKIDLSEIDYYEKKITDIVISKVKETGTTMDGVHHALQLIKDHGIKIGLASSSPMALIETVLSRTGLTDVFTITTSAEHLPYGKPHPQVYLDCAQSLGSEPTSCFCLEDSFNGMLAAKSARMKCIVVPHPAQFNEGRWQAADLSLNSLTMLTSKNLADLTK